MLRYNELKVWLQKGVLKSMDKKQKIMSPAGFEPATS